jgi:hypothetical protein
MKRCPQCEFIYEDEQNICDMDGTMLAFDASGAADAVKQSPLRSFAVPALVGSMLAALLFLAFYASPLLVAGPDARSRPAETQTSPIGSPIAEPTATQPAGAQPSPYESPGVVSDGRRSEQAAMSAVDDRKDSAGSRLAIRRGLPPLPRVPSLPRLPPARVGKQESSTAGDKNRDHVQLTSREPKKSSKVGSFLKKTGRMIKKPFKL